MKEKEMSQILNKDNSPHFRSSTQSSIKALDESTLNKLLPPLSDWPKFSGTGEYDHITFIKYLDHILNSYGASENIVLIRLPRLFTDVAQDWFVTKQQAIGHQDWATWKQLIHAQFGTRIWKKKMLKAFETDYFDPTKHSAHKWCLTQKKRLDCIYNNLTQEEINEKILDQCKGSLDHAVRSRISLDTDLTNLISIMEEVIEMTGLSRKYKESTPRISATNNPEAVKDIKKEEAPRTSSNIICHNCGERGHRKIECSKPKKVFNITVDQEEDIEDTQSQFEAIITDPEESLNIVVIQADIGDELCVNSIQAESNLPQKWDKSLDVGHISDAKLLTNKPEEGRNYTLGKNC